MTFKEIEKLINNPDASVGVCCSHKVVAVGFNTLCYDAERRGIKPSARIKKDGWYLQSTIGPHYHYVHDSKKGKVTIPFHGNQHPRRRASGVLFS